MAGRRFYDTGAVKLKSFKFGDLKFLIDVSKDVPLDPLTAALNALATFNQFLCTPAGQALANANNTLIVDILSKLNVHVTPLVAPNASSK